MGNPTKSRKRLGRQGQIGIYMPSKFTCDYGLYWTPGAGGNFLASLLEPEFVIQNDRNEFVPRDHTWVAMDRFSIDSISLDELDHDRPCKFMGFHQLPIDLIESNQFDPIIRKCFFVLDCRPQDVEFVLALNYAKKYCYPALQDRHYAFEIIQNVAQHWQWKPTDVEKNYKQWKTVFDNAQDIEWDLLGKHLEKYYPYKGNKTAIPITSGLYHFISKSIKNGVVLPTHNQYIQSIKDEWQEDDDIKFFATHKTKIDTLNVNLEIVRMPYHEIFFKGSFPHKFVQHAKNFDQQRIKNYSLSNISLIESFTENLYVSKNFQRYLDTSKELLNTI